MKSDDRNLGMDRSISRRDLLLGMGASAACAFIPGVRRQKKLDNRVA